MSQTQTEPESLDSATSGIIREIMSGEVSGRDAWQGIEILQQYSDYLKDLSENLPPYDLGVVVKVDETKIRFESIDNMANWITGEWYG